MADSAPLKLIQLQIATADKIWDRCLVQSYVPPQEDVEFYYKKLLNFGDAIVTITVEDIPHDFNAALLPTHESAPSDFPANDHETRPDETARREKYKQFIMHLCEMERSRAEVKALHRGTLRSASTSGKPKYTNAIAEEPIYLVGFANDALGVGRRTWVDDVLKDLDAETEYCGDNALTSEDEAPPHGWVLCPTVASARTTLGSRIIVDPVIGRKWERLLGSDTYPDLVSVRRINTKGWSFEDPRSDAFLANLLTWFLASQDLTVTDGVTQFAIGIEKELAKLLNAMRTVKVGERLLDMDDESNPRVKMYKLISKMESVCLDSNDVNPDIQPISENVFHRYLSYACKAVGIPREVFAMDEKIPVILERWTKAQYGFKGGVDPIVPQWKEVWDYVMRGKPSAIRVNHFLASMDAWDPIACSTITNIDRSAIAQEWIKIYMDTQIIKCENNKIKSVILYDQVRKWCLRFIPETVFSSQLSSQIIGPVLTKRGLISSKEKNGRYISGIKFKTLVGAEEDRGGETVASESEIRASETLKEANTVQYTTVTSDNIDGSQTKQRSVEATLIAEKDGTRIEHFFAASVTTETIHLGSF